MNFLLNFVENSINKQLNYVQSFVETRQRNNQSIKNFNIYLINLKTRLTSYNEKQQMIHLFTKLKFNFRDVVTNYQNVFTIKTKLLLITICLKNNMKRNNKSFSQINKKSKNFFDRKRKTKNSNVEKKSRRRRDTRKKNDFKTNDKKKIV